MIVQHRQLDAFRAVMLTGSASRAAERLGITQPAVSRSLAELERSVGFPLFERVRGRLLATPEAGLLMAEVERSYSGLDRIRAEAARIRDFGAGSLRIATLSALAVWLVPRAVRRFRMQWPDAVITLQIHATSTVRDLVADGQFDLGLVAEEADFSGLEHQAFGNFPAVCVIPSGHRLSGHGQITPRDLDGEAFVALAPEDRARLHLEALVSEAGSRPKVVVETPNSATIYALVAEGAGIGLSNPMARPRPDDPRIVLRPFVPNVSFRSAIVYRPDAQRSRIVRAFTAALFDAR